MCDYNVFPGPMKFYGPTSQNYDFDLGPIMVNDWLHAPASSLYYLELEGTPPVPSSILMQGQGIYMCQLGEPCIQRTNYYTVNFTAGTTYKMSLINSGTDTQLTFWLQAHSFTVVGTDFVAIEPYVTDTINIAVGQRYEIIVTANATIKSGANEGNFWMHARDCSKLNSPSTLGIIRYNASSTANPCDTSGDNRQSFGCADPPTSKLVPIVRRQVQQPVNNLTTSDYLNGALQGYPVLTDLSGPLHKWILGKHSMYLNWSEPTLKVVNDYANLTEEHMAPSTAPIFLDYEAESWVYFLIQNNSTIPSPDHMYYRAAHPIHLHGHDFVIIAQGSTNFDPSTVVMNLDNPPRRDTAMLNINGFLLIGFQIDNPGAWLMHCHIPWHASSGMAVQFVSMPDLIAPLLKRGNVIDKLNKECAAWTYHYDNVNIPAGVFQDESGI